MHLPSLSMQYRITLSVALAVAIILAGFGFFALTAVQDSRDAARDERRDSAQALATQVDGVITRIAERLTFVAERAGMVTTGGVAERDLLLIAHHDLLFSAPMTFSDLGGNELWAVGAGPDVVAVRGAESISTMDGAATAQACSSPDGALYLCMTTMVSASASLPGGSLMVVLDARDPALGLLPGSLIGTSAKAELLGPSAEIVAASVDPEEATDHSSVLATAIAVGEITVAKHETHGSTHLVSYAPLQRPEGWGVAVEQESDVALAVANRLEGRFWIFGAVALGAVVVLAWLDVRQVVKPVRELTARAHRMAGGDLTTPIGISGRGEIGELGQSFETMRGQLQDSLEEIERRDRELEDRVQRRTAEVQRLFEELRAKEADRSRLLEKVITVQEEERKRLARELHDDTAQALTAVAMSLESATADLDAEPVAAREGLQRAYALATATIDDLRRMISNLRPSLLDALGLVPAVRALAENRLEEQGISVQLRATGMDERLPDAVEIGVYRIVQEAISNIARHADATHVAIRLQRTADGIEVSVSDDGRGFVVGHQVRERPSGRGLGLLGMQERAALLGGTARIDSEPGRGTRVTVSVTVSGERAP